LYLLVGVLLVAVAVLASFVKRLPLSETMIYLAAGTFLGPLGLGLFSIAALAHAGLIERLAEIAVIVSLFTTGLKLRVPLRDRQWWIPFGLATGSMVLTVGMVTLVGVYGLGYDCGAVLPGDTCPDRSGSRFRCATRKRPGLQRLRFSLPAKRD
jgi:NhaP-type Na+/H+ or K+/H+ antiporter